MNNNLILHKKQYKKEKQYKHNYGTVTKLFLNKLKLLAKMFIHALSLISTLYSLFGARH